MNMKVINKNSTIHQALIPVKLFWLLSKCRSKWRKKNPHNRTRAMNIFPIDQVQVGKGTYGDLTVLSFGGVDRLSIGSYCSIAGNVTFILGGEHGMKTLSTFPFERHVFGNVNKVGVDKSSKGPVIIDDDVWIGHGAIILSGVHIGQGAVIGAGSIVSKDIPPYAVYAGNSVKHYRFSKDIIKNLLRIEYSQLDNDSMERLRKIVAEEITSDNAECIVNTILGISREL